MKVLFLAIVTALILPFSAKADLSVAGIGSYHLSDNYTLASPNPPESISAKTSYAIGALIFLPIVPTLSARAGLIYEKLRLDDTGTFGTDAVTLENILIPLDVQYSLPIENLYVFGGGVLALNYNSPSTPHDHPDLRLNAGIGYQFIQLGPIGLGAEAEYMMGLMNISSSPGYSLKTNTLALNIIGKFGL